MLMLLMMAALLRRWQSFCVDEAVLRSSCSS